MLIFNIRRYSLSRIPVYEKISWEPTLYSQKEEKNILFGWFYSNLRNENLHNHLLLGGLSRMIIR